MLTREKYEVGWVDLLLKYGLQKHPYLTQIMGEAFQWEILRKYDCTQRSETANHMLKTYVPPACTMRLLVRQYEKLQLDRESEENY